MKTLKRGFTLIELLVVIAIIGILSSVVLASLNTARNKGKETAVKSNLANIRPQAEMLYDSDGDYDAVCGANSVTQNAIVANMLTAAGTAGGGSAVCGKPSSGSATAWAASAPLNNGGYWCVDSTGVAKSESNALGANSTNCQ